MLDKLKEYLTVLKKDKNKAYITIAIIGVIVAIFFSTNLDNDTAEIKEDKNQDEEVEEEKEKKETNKIYVDVSGEVKNPNVYMVNNDTRIFQVIEIAGGLTKNADTSNINQAEKVSDGLKINIPKKNANNQSVDAITRNSASNNYNNTSSSSAGNKININTADAKTLENIPGIGPSKAEDIIEYRKTKGLFKKIEDIQEIKGIGEKTFKKMKDYITI